MSEGTFCRVWVDMVILIQIMEISNYGDIPSPFDIIPQGNNVTIGNADIDEPKISFKTDSDMVFLDKKKSSGPPKDDAFIQYRMKRLRMLKNWSSIN